MARKIKPLSALSSQTVLDALPFQLAIVDSRGVISKVNKGWTRFARSNGADARTAEGRGLDYLKAASADRTAHGKKVLRGLKDVLSGKSGEFESEYACHSPRKPRWFIMRVSALEPMGSGAVIAHFDITERVLAEKALKVSKRSLAEALEKSVDSEKQKDRFVAQMSHEIRTPITGIFGMLDLLREPNTPSERLALVDKVYGLAEHLLGVVNDALDLSKAEAGSLAIQSEALDPEALVAEVRSVLEPAAREKGLNLVHACGEPFPKWVLGDGRRIRQILFNLVNNALKFTAQGGISIRADAVYSEGGEVTLAFRVRDSGKGIPGDKRHLLFKRFSQIDDDAGRAAMGTGLGLVISRALAEAMGGGIELESSDASGSVFKASIKVRPCPAPEPALPTFPHHPGWTAVPARETGIPSGAPLHECPQASILVAEDNPVNLGILCRILGKMGFAVTSARDGVEALDLFEKAEFSAVLLDCQMPNMDGYATARAIRSREARLNRGRTPIVAITADALAQNRDLCLVAGMDGFLTKPYRPEEISLALMQVTAKGRP